MKTLLILVILSSSAAAEPIERWTAPQVALQVVASGLLVADWLQTRQVAQDPLGREQNPILGRRPSLGRVNTYFAVCLLVQATVAVALPQPWREAWQSGWIGVEGYTVHGNWAGGYRVVF